MANGRDLWHSGEACTLGEGGWDTASLKTTNSSHLLPDPHQAKHFPSFTIIYQVCSAALTSLLIARPYSQYLPSKARGQSSLDSAGPHRDETSLNVDMSICERRGKLDTMGVRTGALPLTGLW